MLSSQHLNLHQWTRGAALMIATTKTGRRTQRVLNILHSINEDISKSGALELIGEDGTRAVPFGLRRSVARTAIHMLDEAARKKKKKKPLSPEEMEKRAAKWEEGRAERDMKKDAVNAAQRKSFIDKDLRTYPHFIHNAFLGQKWGSVLGILLI